MLLYLIGPYSGTKEQIQKNIESARLAASDLRKKGHVVIVPHLESLGCENSLDYEGWMNHGFEIIKAVEGIAIFGDYLYSKGSMREIFYSIRLSKPLFFIYDESGNCLFDG